MRAACSNCKVAARVIMQFGEANSKVLQLARGFLAKGKTWDAGMFIKTRGEKLVFAAMGGDMGAALSGRVTCGGCA